MASGNATSDQKKATACRGVVLFGDEVSFWLDGTLHQTWSRIGQQPRVETWGGMRQTAHVFGAVSLEAEFSYRFAEVFNGTTFLRFLKQLVARYRGRKIFLVIDNGPCHNLNAVGQLWLRANSSRLELFRLPPYSPELNPIEPVWKTTRKMTTHNRFYPTALERDTQLRRTFRTFQQRPRLISAHVARFR